MDQRHIFRTVIENGSPLPEDGITEFYLAGLNHFYVGHEILRKDGSVYTWYFWPLSKDEALIFLYIDEVCFDELVRNLEECNYQAFYNAWPLLMDALKRGSEDNYGAPALIKLGHTEHEGSFWCLALKLENVDMLDVEQRFSPYVSGKFKVLIEYLSDMNEQFSNNDVSNFDLIKGGVIKGFKISRALKIAGGIAAALLGVPEALGIGGNE